MVPRVGFEFGTGFPGRLEALRPTGPTFGAFAKVARVAVVWLAESSGWADRMVIDRIRAVGEQYRY
jgi:hypothetical protein